MNVYPSSVFHGHAFALGALCLVWTQMGCEGATPEKSTTALEAAIEETRPVSQQSSGSAPRMPWQDTNPHRFKLFSKFVLESPTGQMHGVTVNRLIDRGLRGKYRIFDERMWVHPEEAADGELEGREILYDGEQLFIRRAWGPWMEREVLGGLETRYLLEAYEDIESLIQAFKPYMSWSELPEKGDTFMGVKVMWHSVTLDRQVEPREAKPEELTSMRLHETRWKEWLRLTHRPRKLEGRLAKRQDGIEAYMVGSFQVEGDVLVGSETWGFKAELRGRVLDLPLSSFEVPKDVLSSRRKRPWRMIRDVMGESLAEPYDRW
jgi:hypothetical protein